MQSKFIAIALLAVLTFVPIVALAAPTLSVTKGGGTQANGNLDDNGNWVWRVQVSNSNPVPPGGSPLSAELGFTATVSQLLGASNLSTGANDDFYILKPGTPIFGWEQLTDFGGGNMKAVGLQTNCASGCTVNGSANQVFSSLSSVNYTTVGPHDYIQIVTQGPVGGPNPRLTTTLTVSGAFGNKGRITENNASGVPVDYDTFSGVFSRSVIAGDANMSGMRDGGDLGLVLTNFGRGPGGFSGPVCISPNTHACVWYHGEMTGDGLVSSGDLNFVLTNYGETGGVGLSDGLSLVGTTVPEPSSCLLLAMSTIAAAIGHRRRKSVPHNRV